MNRISRREFLGFRFAARGTAETFRDLPPEAALPPEFSPVLLRAEAVRLGLDPERIDAGELASAVMHAMYARAPEGGGRIG